MSKRIKHVFSSHWDCAHRYASQTEEEQAGNKTAYPDSWGEAGNVSFKGNVASSYGHYPIVNIISWNKQRALVQSNTYSVSTSQHIGIFCSALSHFKKLHVPHIEPGGIVHGWHIENIKYFYDSFVECIDKNKRSTQYEYYSDAIIILTNAREYCQWFKIKSKLPAKHRRFIDCNTQELQIMELNKLAEIRERRDRLNTPEAEAKREKARMKRAELAARKVEEQRRKDAEAIERWRAGERVDHIPYHRGAFLRLNADKTRVETSKHAQVLTEHAAAIWPIVKRSHDKQVTYPGNGFKIDMYKVTRIENGDMVIGCHNIPYAEMESIAKQLNLIK